MKNIYAYLKTFEMLNDYWKTTKNLDLGSVLSGMNPDPLYDTPYLSADPAAFSDWSTAWNKIVGVGEEGTDQQVFDVTMSFLDYYVEDVGYQLGDVESYLKAGLGLAKNEFAAVG
jgi:hypothetical protein